MELSTPLAFPSLLNAKEIAITAGGQATNQAIAAARSGAKTSLIGTIGNDLFGKTILETLRREGIQTSGIVKSDSPTSFINAIIDQNGEKAIIVSEGASTEATSKQIPDNMLNERILLLLQNDLAQSIHIDLLKRAQNGGAKSMMCLSHPNNLDTSFFDYLDIVIIKDSVLPHLCDILSIPNENSVETLAKEKNMHCVLVKSDGLSGTYAVSKHGKQHKEEGQHKNVAIDPSGAFDSFCGTFAACIQAGLNLPRSIKYATSSCALTSMTQGTYNAFPYLGDIEEHLN